MRHLIVAALGAALLLLALSAGAQAPPPYGAPTGHDAAKAIAASEAEARKNGWFMVTAVVDGGGRLVAFSRMDGAILGSIDIALGKATTANNLKRPTKALQDLVGQGGSNLPARRAGRHAARGRRADRRRRQDHRRDRRLGGREQPGRRMRHGRRQRRFGQIGRLVRLGLAVIVRPAFSASPVTGEAGLRGTAKRQGQ